MSIFELNKRFAEALGCKLFPVQSASVKLDTKAVIVEGKSTRLVEINFAEKFGEDYMYEIIEQLGVKDD